MKKRGYEISAMFVAVAFILSMLAFAVPSAVFETDANETFETVLAEEEYCDEALKKYPVTFQLNERVEDAALLSDEKTIYIEDIYSWDMFLSEDSFHIEVYIKDVHDAKYNLKAYVEDENGVVVAEQELCEYNYWYSDSLLYTMKVVDGAEIDVMKDYTVSFTYSGSYNVELRTDYFYVAFDDEVVFLDGKIIDYENGTFALHFANLDEDKEYLISNYVYDEELGYSIEKLFETEVSDGGYLTFSTGDMFDLLNSQDNYDCITYYFDLIEKDSYGEYYWVCSMKSTFDKHTTGETYMPYDSFGFDASDILSLDDETVSGYLYCTAAEERYYLSDLENIDIYLLDSVTGKKVGILSEIEFEDDYGEFYCEIEITQELVNERRYFFVVDDGYSIRLFETYAVNKPYLEAVYFYNQKDGYYSTSANHADRLQCSVFESKNIIDVSKIECFIEHEDYDLCYAIDKDSIESENGIIRFCMDAVPGAYFEVYSYDYILYFYYDSELIYRSDVYFSVDDEYDDDSEFDPDFWFGARNVFLNDGYLNVYSTGYYLNCDFSDIEFSLYDYYTGELFANYSSVEVLNSVDWGYETEIEFIVKFPVDDVTSLYDVDEFKFFASIPDEYDSYDWFYLSDIELNGTCVYAFSKHSDGYVYFFGSGLDDSAEYDLWFYDENIGKEVNVPLTKVRGKDILKAKADDLLGVYSYDLGVYIDENNEHIGVFEAWEFWFTNYSGTRFYTQYEKQNHRFAIVNLPSGLYTRYKLASSLDELNKKSFLSIENSVLYELPEKAGKHVIYAQFMDAKGNVSEVMASVVSYEKLELNEIQKAKFYYEYNEYYDEYCIDAVYEFVSGADGEVNICFYDIFGNVLFNDYMYVKYGHNEIDCVYYFAKEEFDVIANYLTFELIDNNGSFTEPYYAEIELIPYFTEYEYDGDIFVIDNFYKELADFITTKEIVEIPTTYGSEELSGIKQFTSDSANCPNLLGVIIPSTITYISDFAFECVPDITLYVREGSFAHVYAKEMEMNYEFISYIAGDINCDDYVDLHDAVLLLQYSMFPELYPLEYAGDVDFNDDGAIDLKDAILVLQHSMFPELYPIK